MYIEKMKIANLRCFPSVELKLSKGVNIIIGKNNTGKSTVLKTFYILQNKNILNKSDCRIGTTSCTIEATIGDLTHREMEQYFGAQKGKNTEDSGTQRIQFELSETVEKLTLKDDSLSEKDKEKHVSVYGDKVLKEKAFGGFPEMEDKGNFIYPFLSSRRTNNYNGQMGKEATFAVHPTLYNLPAKILKVSQQPKTRDQFKDLCKKILGIEVHSIPGDANELKIGSYIDYKNTIPMSAMGEGVPNVAGLLSIILTENNKLLLIEEIENDLHPAALKVLLDQLAEKPKLNQIVISTHSNIVLKRLGALPEARIFLVESETAVVDVPTATITEVKNSPLERRMVLELLGYELEDYDLFKAYLIFEESSAETIVRDYLIPYFTPNLRGRIRTIAAQGVDDLENKAGNLLNTFLFLHLNPIYADRVWVFADGDPAGVNAIAKIKRKLKDLKDFQRLVTFSQQNFEFYYPEEFQARAEAIFKMDVSERRDAKKTLLLEVINWLNNNPDQALMALERSAKEIIETLKLIEIQLDTPPLNNK